ncbi:MAG: hypothetical protein GX873_02640, partial [Parcubacteria group bacterium]|nr:hypothetical protein [Parcubacteria group bacterium]
TICNGTNIYISLPSSIDLSNINNLPTGVSWVQVSEDNLRKSNGTGWIPIDISSTYGVSMSTLPFDPQNTLNDSLYYTFYCNPQQEYILTSYMESKTFGPKGNETSKTNKDGGPDPYLYEVGNNLFISPLKPVGSWSFDEGTGTIANDSSGNDNNGTLISGPTWTDGQINKAISFDGVNDYVDCGNIPQYESFSISIWVNPTANPNQTNSSYLSVYDGLDSNLRFNIAQGSFYNFIRWRLPDGNYVNYTLSDNGSLNQWAHYVITYDGVNDILKGYKNGQLQYTYNTGIYSNFGHFVRIGMNGVNNLYFTGLIDEPRFYNRALSAEEIKRHYEMSK